MSATVPNGGNGLVAYLITNTVDGKKYVGITKRYAHRLSYHRAMGYGSRGYVLHAAMRKHGIERFSFAIIASAARWEDLQALERDLIREHRSYINDGWGYNLTRGGEGVLGLRHSEATRQKQRIASTGRVPGPETRAKLSGPRPPEFGAAVSEGRRRGSGWEVSAATKAKISATLTGRPFAAARRQRLLGDEARMEKVAALGRANKGRRASDETKERMRSSQAKRLETADRALLPGVRAICTPEGVFASSALAAEFFGIPRHTAWARARRGTPGWGFAE